MSKAWKPSIQRRGKLSVYFDASTRSAVWSHVLGNVLHEFNVVAERHGINLRLSSSDQVPTATAGAEVAVHVASGDVAMTFCGKEVTEEIISTAMGGATRPVDEEGGKTKKAIVFLPSKPQISVPKGPRGVGSKVLMFIALHELLHAAGMEDSDHAQSGLFQTFPEVDAGSSPDHDRVRSQRGAHAWMPPFTLAPDSVQTMLDLWPK